MTIDPAFDPLKERLQRAVAPDYRVEHRIGEGGMGVVYRGARGTDEPRRGDQGPPA